jgi:hypothetical protein
MKPRLEIEKAANRALRRRRHWLTGAIRENGRS